MRLAIACPTRMHPRLGPSIETPGHYVCRSVLWLKRGMFPSLSWPSSNIYSELFGSVF